MSTAIIFVRGGMIQSVLTDDPSLETIILDEDSTDLSDEHTQQYLYQGEQITATVCAEAPTVDAEGVAAIVQQLAL